MLPGGSKFVLRFQDRSRFVSTLKVMPRITAAPSVILPGLSLRKMLQSTRLCAPHAQERSLCSDKVTG